MSYMALSGMKQVVEIRFYVFFVEERIFQVKLQVYDKLLNKLRKVYVSSYLMLLKMLLYRFNELRGWLPIFAQLDFVNLPVPTAFFYSNYRMRAAFPFVKLCFSAHGLRHKRCKAIIVALSSVL